MAKEDYQNQKVWRTTIVMLRQLYAWTGESMVSIIDRLVRAEYEKIKKEKGETKDGE